MDVAAAAPLAFVAGVLVGLIASSRWRIIRRAAYDRWAARHADED